jgi:hypothetical protein
MSRRQLNTTFFEKLYVEDDHVSTTVLTRTFADLGGAVRLEEVRRTSNTKKTAPSGAVLSWSDSDLLAAVASAGGSSKTALVGLEGLEPPTSAM